MLKEEGMEEICSYSGSSGVFLVLIWGLAYSFLILCPRINNLGKLVPPETFPNFCISLLNPLAQTLLKGPLYSFTTVPGAEA